MYSTFSFSGIKISDQTIARDVNALNAKLSELDEQGAEELKAQQVENVRRALSVFEDDNDLLDDPEGLEAIFDEEVNVCGSCAGMPPAEADGAA